jgi:hypothetical protein
MEESRVSADATRAYMFSIKSKSGSKPNNGGNKLKHKPSVYGIAIKWLIFVKGMTYAQFADMYNGTTAQNANYLINRISKDRFYEENLDKMCQVLGISFDYFSELCEKIEEKMEQ